MILLDANLLVHAALSGSPDHDRARDWFDLQLASAPRIGLPWQSLLGFVRLASNVRIFRRGPSAEEAWQIVRHWLSAENVWIPVPTERHADILESIFAGTSLRSASVMDAHLAALAIEHGLVLCSADTDYARFPALRWFNPLAA